MSIKIGYVTGNNELVFNITTKCNNFCMSCPNEDSFRKINLSTKQIKGFLKENANSNIRRVAIIGGEPTLADNFIEIIDNGHGDRS